ncbi:MAG TPA: alpha/beta fold hydrolase [Anaerolineales bacterium]
MIRPICLVLLVFLVACRPESVPTHPVAPTSPAPASPTAPSVALSATPSPTVAQLIYPYTIDGLRHHQFQSGVIKIISTLSKTDIYTSYLISYPSDGLRITGVMQIPAQGHAPFPVILMDHGYFNREQYKSGDGTDRAAEYLNKHGYLTLSSDYRSWGGSDAGPSLFYSGLAIDVINLLNAVPSIPQADPQRVGIWGHSMGGAVTMKVLTVDPRLRAGVLYSTVSADDADVLRRWGLGCIGDIAAGERQLDCNSSDVVPLSLAPDLIQAYYRASTDAAVLEQTSPIDHLGLVTAPVEINYGTKDGQTSAGTPPEWSQKLYNAFEQAGKDAQLYAYEGEFHSFNGDAWIAFMERSARFFDQYVKGAEVNPVLTRTPASLPER